MDYRSCLTLWWELVFNRSAFLMKNSWCPASGLNRLRVGELSRGVQQERVRRRIHDILLLNYLDVCITRLPMAHSRLGGEELAWSFFIINFLRNRPIRAYSRFVMSAHFKIVFLNVVWVFSILLLTNTIVAVLIFSNFLPLMDYINDFVFKNIRVIGFVPLIRCYTV